MTSRERITNNPRGQSLVLAMGYLICVAVAVTSFLTFAYRTPTSVDKGIAIISRAYFYQLGFAEVRKAADELREEHFESAEKRLTRYLNSNPDVQRSQLRTHPFIASQEMLADLLLADGKLGRTQEALAVLTQTVPLHYRAWFLRGKAEQAAGDLEAASASFDRAFRLSLINTEVVESYLYVLQELGEFETALWVDDQYARAERRASPAATVSLGQARPDWQRQVLSGVGIPIEHGRFFRTFTVRGLERGGSRTLGFPEDIFEDWPSWAGRLVIQVRFEHIFEDLKVEAVRYRLLGSHQGWQEEPLEQGHVRYLHHPHSSAEFTAEFELELDPSKIGVLEVIYSCPEHSLSDQAKAIVAKARANAAALEGGK